MTLSTKLTRGVEYLYFQAGRKSLYIGPKNGSGQARIDNVIEALDYSRERIDHYTRSFDELLPLLPPDLRKKHLAGEIVRLQDKIARYRKLRS